MFKTTMFQATMFQAMRQRWRDMGTVKALCRAAEAHARDEGIEQPGAEHFVLAALDMPEGSARRALQRLRLTPADFRAGVQRQYQEALRHLGIEPPAFDAPPLPSTRGRGLYRAQPSGQDLMQVLTRQIMAPAQRANAAAPLLGAHVLLAALAAQHGVAIRAFRALGVEAPALREAALAEIGPRAAA